MSQDAYTSTSRSGRTRCPNCDALPSSWRMMEQRCTECDYVHKRPGEVVTFENEEGQPATPEQMAARAEEQERARRARAEKAKRAGYRRRLAWAWTFFWVGAGIHTLGWAGFFMGLGVSYLAHAWVRWGDG